MNKLAAILRPGLSLRNHQIDLQLKKYVIVYAAWTNNQFDFYCLMADFWS